MVNDANIEHLGKDKLNYLGAWELSFHFDPGETWKLYAFVENDLGFNHRNVYGVKDFPCLGTCGFI